MVVEKYEYEQYLVLPSITKVKKTAKVTVIAKPDISLLTEEQLSIYEKIIDIKIGEFSQTLLTGYSGTGKTYLTTKIIEGIIFKNKSIKIAITAPTNKAVTVLKNLSSICETHKQVSFKTLHSLLGLKRVITNDGKEEYKVDFKGGDADTVNMIIVDEVSMLDNEVYNTLIAEAELYNIMLLFIGDRGQIPPVNGGESVLFSFDLENNFNLSKIIRQANGNPIINLAEKIRNNESFKLETTLDADDNGIIFLKINTEMKLLETLFNSKNFSQDANFVKVLAWTNTAVDYYNDKIRKIIYGENCGRLNIGEKMVCNKPVTNSTNQVILNNNEEFDVISFELKQETTGNKFWHYAVKVLSSGGELTIKMLAEKSETTFKKVSDGLLKEAKNASVIARRSAWVKYYNLQSRFANVKYNYALTVHKAQGSTFDNAIVIKRDINRVGDVKERNKLLYTAVTRVKNKLFII